MKVNVNNDQSAQMVRLMWILNVIASMDGSSKIGWAVHFMFVCEVNSLKCESKCKQ